MSENLNKTTKIKIEFASWLGKAALEIDAETTKEAVEKAAALAKLMEAVK